MTTTTTETPSTSPLSAFERFISNLGTRYEGYTRVRSRRDEIEMLEAKSDAELAEMGIRRDGIACHVFKDKFYS